MRTWFEEVWNQQKTETIYRLFSADTAIHGLPGAPMRGHDAFKGIFDSFCGAFPDIHIDVVQTVTQGDTVVAHCRVTATHTGDGLGLPPTNRRVEFEGVTIGRIREGQFVEGWNFYDFLSMYQQIGALPPLPGA
jgi:steroid delta-isomerase-like uncharacterized protein